MDIDQAIEDMKNSFVHKYYIQDPEKEFLVTSNLLQNGMEVLIADPKIRANLDSIVAQPGLFNVALERNRWCKISGLREVSGAFKFTGTYDDGTQRLRSGYRAEGWLVKLDSVDVLQQKRNAVREQDIASCVMNGCNSTLAAYAERTTENIMRIFGMGASKK